MPRTSNDSSYNNVPIIWYSLCTHTHIFFARNTRMHSYFTSKTLIIWRFSLSLSFSAFVSLFLFIRFSNFLFPISSSLSAPVLDSFALHHRKWKIDEYMLQPSSHLNIVFEFPQIGHSIKIQCIRCMENKFYVLAKFYRCCSGAREVEKSYISCYFNAKIIFDNTHTHIYSGTRTCNWRFQIFLELAFVQI